MIKLIVSTNPSPLHPLSTWQNSFSVRFNSKLYRKFRKHEKAIIYFADPGRGTGKGPNLIGLVHNDTTSNSTLIVAAARSTSQLVGLLAISHTSALNEAQKERVHDLLARYDQHNAYGAHIFQEYKDTSYWKLYLIGAALILIAFSVYGYRFYKKQLIARIWRELSQREMDIVGLILSGKSNKEVALALSIELSTVKTHVNNIYAKLGVNNRKDLDRYKGLMSKPVTD